MNSVFNYISIRTKLTLYQCESSVFDQNKFDLNTQFARSIQFLLHFFSHKCCGAPMRLRIAQHISNPEVTILEFTSTHVF